MKIFPKDLLMRLTSGAAMWFCFFISAQAQEPWYGRYMFETTGINGTHSRSWVEQETLDVRREGDQLVANYSATMNGDLLVFSERWLGRDFGDRIAFTYDQCLAAPDKSCQDSYVRGDPMLTFSYKARSGKGRILITKFQKFVPLAPPRNTQAVEYFRKIQVSDDL
jgi:hypothetical protein